MKARSLAALLAAPLLLSAAPGPAVRPLANPAVSATVDVRISITALRSERGVVRACMTPDPNRFPRCQGDEAAYLVVVPADQARSLDFTGVRPGTYAIALLHDENANGKADRALGMMPKEGFGFSRDARIRMGPPAFGDAAFTVADVPLNQTIRMRYML